MSALVKAILAEELAKVERVQVAPIPPFGFGTDLFCDRDLDERAIDVSGNRLLALAQALYRRLDCPRGQMPDDPSYGLFLEGFLNRGTTDEDIDEMAGA